MYHDIPISQESPLGSSRRSWDLSHAHWRGRLLSAGVYFIIQYFLSFLGLSFYWWMLTIVWFISFNLRFMFRIILTSCIYLHATGPYIHRSMTDTLPHYEILRTGRYGRPSLAPNLLGLRSTKLCTLLHKNSDGTMSVYQYNCCWPHLLL